MTRHLLLATLLFVLLVSLAHAAPPTTDNAQRVFEAVIHLQDVSDLAQLKPYGLMITSRHDLDLIIYASAEEVAFLREAGYRIEVLGRVDQIKTKEDYRSFAQAVTDLETLVDAHSSIASMFSIGTSEEGRDIWAIKISDNVGSDEAEPAILYDFSVHGDEQIGTELAFGFLEMLLTDYGTDTRITDLVDSYQIYLIPMINPDGYYHVRRGNGNYVDINRNFPFWWEGGTWSAEVETEALIDFSLVHNPVIYINYHSGAEIINYTWDGIETLSPDNEIEIMISETYDEDTNYGIINGAAWYVADGTLEDWHHGSLGAASVIVELSNVKMPSNISYYVDLNLPAMLDYSELPGQGLRGVVTDSVTDESVEATILVGNHLPVMSDPDDGDYYRVLEAGTYTIYVWANGYGWKTINDVTVPSGDFTTLNVSMDAPTDDFAAMRCVINMRKDSSDDPANVTLPKAALGGPNDNAFSLGVNGWAVFDMGANTPVSCDETHQIYVTEKATDGADGYTVKVAEDWNGPWESLGTGTGSHSFDLDIVTFSTIRYVRIEDDGDGSNYSATPGADIDSIEVVEGAADDDTVDDDTTDDDTVDDDTTDDDSIDDDTTDDDTTDDDTVDDDTVDDDTNDDDTIDDDTADDDTTDDDTGDDDDDTDDDDIDDDDISDDDDTDDDATRGDDDDDDGCGC